MQQLKLGDNVKLREDLSLSQNIRYLRKNTKGKIVNAHDHQGYTVVFEGDVTPVAYLSDREIELDIDN